MCSNKGICAGYYGFGGVEINFFPCYCHQLRSFSLSLLQFPYAIFANQFSYNLPSSWVVALHITVFYKAPYIIKHNNICIYIYILYSFSDTFSPSFSPLADHNFLMTQLCCIFPPILMYQLRQIKFNKQQKCN